MIQLKTIREIDDKTNEGKLLIAALAILTSLQQKDIKNNIWGGSVHPDQGLSQLKDLANKIYFEKEWKAEEKSKERNRKIEQVINDRL